MITCLFLSCRWSSISVSASPVIVATLMPDSSGEEWADNCCVILVSQVTSGLWPNLAGSGAEDPRMIRPHMIMSDLCCMTQAMSG